MFLSTVSSRFSLILCPRRRLGVLVGQVGSVGEEFKDIEGGILGVLVKNLQTLKVLYWVDVSESSGAGSPGLSSIKGY